MPTARYSWRAISPKFRVSAASPIAAKPSVSGHCEKPLLPALAPSVYWKWLRGSELIVTGMPSRDCSASVWIWLAWTAMVCASALMRVM